jgi:hypothetical protein
MSKPMGMTAGFQIIRPTRTEDKVWDAVEEAISENWTPERFIREAQQAWESALKEQIRYANKDFDRLGR